MCLQRCKEKKGFLNFQNRKSVQLIYNWNMSKKKDFKFIDLFAGIGGFRIAFDKQNGDCVFSSEYDRFSQLTYKAFFGEVPDFSNIVKVDPPGDITQIDAKDIPPHDILLGGFPCQPFSLAGVSKKNSLGKPHGFDDPTQGTLFFNIKAILLKKTPKAFLLENVKNLERHDKGNTFRVITETLRALDYDIFYRVIDGAGWVPQHRERIYIVGFKKELGIHEFPEFYELKPPKKRPKTLADILEDPEKVPEKYILKKGTWSTLERHKKYHAEQGNGFGYGLISPPFEDKTTRTLSARYHKDGAEILIDIGEKIPRRLTPLECCRLMGFPKKYQKFFERNEKYPQPVSDTQAYRQFGNSVVVPVVTAIAEIMVKKLKAVGAFDG